ncbi:hypothetical protein Q5752_005029 [Cryptotrichosporon argae]
MQSLRNLLASAPPGYSPLPPDAASPPLSGPSKHAPRSEAYELAASDSGHSSSTNSTSDNAAAPFFLLAPTQHAARRAGGGRARPLIARTATGLLILLAVVGSSYLIMAYTLTESAEGETGDLSALPEISGVAVDVGGQRPSVLAESNGVYVLDDPTHVLVPLGPPEPQRLLRPLSTRPALDHLMSYYSTGALADAPPPEQPPVDLVYLYVNASSPFFQRAKESKEQEEGIAVKGKARHWRDNGELRGAIRSGATSLGKGVRNVHVVSAAFEVTVERVIEEDDGEIVEAKIEVETGTDSVVVAKRKQQDDVAGAVGADNEEDDDALETDIEGADDEPIDLVEADTYDPDFWASRRWAMGQVPAWLDWARSARLKWHFHPSIYQLPRDDDGLLPPAIERIDEGTWRREALPTFNSFEIETRLAFIPGVAEHFVASNDDMFLLRDLAVADFHHPLLGAVVRLDPSSSLAVRPEVTPDLHSTPGEWGGLQHANVILSARFPRRNRMYMHHMPKAQTVSVAQEANVMYAEALTTASTRAFRESKRGEADVEMAWLVTHTRIERWREALLWTWAVARLGGQDGKWGVEARDEVRLAFGLTEGDEGDVVRFHAAERKTLDDLHDIARAAKWDEPAGTEYTFSSLDGHLPNRPDVRNMPTSCDFSLHQCLATDFFASDRLLDAADVFTRLAFEMPGCGDCMITALVAASGARGLGAFLPKEGQAFVPPARKRRRDAAGLGARRTEFSMWERDEPMLPLTSTWQAADFSAAANVRLGQDAWAGHEPVPGQVNLRAWAVKLLSRYAYVFGNTPARFDMVHGPYELTRDLQSIDNDAHLALACINDDVGDRADNQVAQRLGTWMEARWGGDRDGVDWEKDAWSWL